MIGWLASKGFMMGAKANVKKLQNSPTLFGALEDYRKDTITSRIKYVYGFTVIGVNVFYFFPLEPPSSVPGFRYASP